MIHPLPVKSCGNVSLRITVLPFLKPVMVWLLGLLRGSEAAGEASWRSGECNGGAAVAEASERPRRLLQRRRRTGQVLEGSVRPREERAVLPDVRQSSEEALEPFGAVERRDETAVAPASCRGRAGGGGSRTARGGLEKLVGVLAKLKGVFGVATELQSDGTTLVEL